MFDFFKDRDTAELWFWWAGVVLPIVTIGAIFFAAVQVAEAKRSARATFLLNLVDKWNSKNMYESRVAFNDVELKTKEHIFNLHAGLSDKEVMKKLREHFKIVMGDLNNKDPQKYSITLGMMSFFELVGGLVKRRYVAIADIDGLFRGTILDVGIAYVLHINDEQQKKGFPPGYYENALFLIAKIEKRCPQ